MPYRLKVVGSANGLQGNVVTANDVSDKLDLVSQSYDRDRTRIVDNIGSFRQSCSTYGVNMYTSAFDDDF